jgi:alanine dehydrogenase
VTQELEQRREVITPIQPAAQASRFFSRVHRSTGTLPVGQPSVSPGEHVFSAGKMPAGRTAKMAVLLWPHVICVAMVTRVLQKQRFHRRVDVERDTGSTAAAVAQTIHGR